MAEVFRPDLLPLVRDSFTMLNEARLDPIWFDATLVRRHTAIYRIIRPGGIASPLAVDQVERLRRMISRVPHEPGLHVLHAELLWLQGRRAEALSEYEAAGEAGLLRPGDQERRRRLIAELTGADSTREGR
ncbi:MAG: hypothetical protein FD129_1947 [bacterium]|nr:MAG: hypothetical protein FD129_1947 [bacterium]